MESKHEHTHTIIRETTERTDTTMKHLHEKMVVIERVQVGTGLPDVRKAKIRIWVVNFGGTWNGKWWNNL
jgi:hypothetical protein